jgi:hypothetical protein
MPVTALIRLLGTPNPSDAQSPRLSQKARVLLTRLLITPHPLRREAVLTMLWPTATEAHARGSLRVTLHMIRQALGPDALRADRRVLSLRQVPPTDLRAFLDAIREGDDLGAVHHYGGPLLADVALYDTTDGDLWLESERLRLARLFEAAVRRVLQRPTATALPAKIRLRMARQLRDSNPEPMEHWRLVLDLVARLGTPEELLREQTAFEVRLARGEITYPPTARTTLPRTRGNAVERGHFWQATSSTLPNSRSIARPDEALDALNADWTRVARGTTACVLITGQTGIGKSALLNRFQHHLSASAASVVAVRATHSARDLPFTLLREVVQQLARQPGALDLREARAQTLATLDDTVAVRFGIGNPTPAALDAPAFTQALVRAVRDLLRNVAADAPTTLLLDNLHCSDAVSRRVLRRATASLSDVPLLVLATARVPLGAAWRAWPRLHLLPLALADARVLVQRLADNVPDAVVDVILERAGGVPLRLLHSVRLAEELTGESPVEHEVVSAAMLDDALWHGGPVAARLRRFLDVAPETALPLALLALWDAPLETAALTRSDLASGSLDDVRAQLGLLRDLVRWQPGDRWSLTHSRVADALRRVASPHLLRTAARQLVHRFDAPDSTARDRHRVRFLAKGYAVHPSVCDAESFDLFPPPSEPVLLTHPETTTPPAARPVSAAPVDNEQ